MGFLYTLSALVALAILAGTAGGEDPPTREEQIQRIRSLPPEEKRRLKEAIARFDALPQAEREALRAKAREVGIARLGELAGRDFEQLKRKHRGMQAEMDEVFRLLGGPERLAGLAPDERAFVRAEATRGFQRHCMQRLLEAERLYAGFEQAPEAEKLSRKSRALEAMAQRLLAEASDEDRARFLALPATAQRVARGKLLAEWRLRETTQFAKKFEGRLLPILSMPPEKRQALIAKRVRWFQLSNLLVADGIGRDTMRMLDQFRADERAQVGEFYEQGRDLPVAERRARVESKIRELYGKGAVDPSRTQRPLLRHAEMLRERALRERRRTDTPDTPDTPDAPDAPDAPPK